MLEYDKSINNKIYNSMVLTKNLHITSVIYGEKYLGKRYIARKVYKNYTWIDGNNISKFKDVIKNNEFLVIDNFEKVSDLSILNLDKKGIVAIYHNKNIFKKLEEKFTFLYNIPPLINRIDDIKFATNYYINLAKNDFDIKDDIVIDIDKIDLSQNLKSLKKYIYKSILFQNTTKQDIENILYNYFYKDYNGENIYHKHISFIDKILLKTGLDIHKSQLKLSKILGINRNTLRKKLNG